MTKIKPRHRIGQSVTMTPNALENYGQKYAGKTFKITHVSTAYMPAKEFTPKVNPLASILALMNPPVAPSMTAPA